MISLNSLWREAMTPADTRDIWQWAEQEGELPAVYAVSGKLDIETCPMIKEPLRALRSPIVRNVVVMSGVQCLKTLLGELWLLWMICNDPGPSQWLQPDDEEAKEHASERFLPLIEKFPAVHKFYTANRHDKKTAFIRFAHMFLRLEGANNPGNVQRKSIKNQMRSEIWQADKWKIGRLKEADSRLTQFVHNSKTYTESQPGWDSAYNVDDMHAEFLKGDQNALNFRCQSCNRLQPFLWDFKRKDGTRAAMRWDDSERTRRESGEWRWGELKQTIRYECIHCGHRHVDDPLTRRRMTASLEFVAANPDCDPATRSFTWNQLAMPSLSWFETRVGGVKNFLIAYQQAQTGADKPLMDFWMKVVAEPYNPAKHSAIGDAETIEIIQDEDAAKPIIANGIEFKYRLMGVDVQADHFWVLIEAWSKRGDSLSLHFEKVFTWDEVTHLQKRFGVADQNVGVDVSHRTHEVKVECTRHGHMQQMGWVCWKALRGSDQVWFIWTPKQGKDKGKKIQLPYQWPPDVGDPCAGLPNHHPRRKEFGNRKCQVITWSNPTIKDMVIARRDGKSKGVQNLVARGDWNDEFNRQMHSQRKVPVAGKYGSDKWKWEKFRDDHGLDCKCMITVRAFQVGLLGPNQEEIEG
jgi:hypothetical protein